MEWKVQLVIIIIVNQQLRNLINIHKLHMVIKLKLTQLSVEQVEQHMPPTASKYLLLLETMAKALSLSLPKSTDICKLQV